jgi:GNAT superfamily N-acetyltransferase
MTLQILSAVNSDEATTVLCEAFAEYPVMRYVLGASPDYATRLHTLVGFFVASRVLRHDLLLGIRGPAGALVAVALVTLPDNPDPPTALAEMRESVWRRLGGDARERYEAFGAATRTFDVVERHHHLNMIGVRLSEIGRGHGRDLLDHVHRVAAEDPASAGVSLTTELQRNIALYERFGYRQIGHAVVAPELETWGMFRGREGVDPTLHHRPTA